MRLHPNPCPHLGVLFFKIFLFFFLTSSYTYWCPLVSLKKPFPQGPQLPSFLLWSEKFSATVVPLFLTCWPHFSPPPLFWFSSPFPFNTTHDAPRGTSPPGPPGRGSRGVLIFQNPFKNHQHLSCRKSPLGGLLFFRFPFFPPTFFFCNVPPKPGMDLVVTSPHWNRKPPSTPPGKTPTFYGIFPFVAVGRGNKQRSLRKLN